MRAEIFVPNVLGVGGFGTAGERFMPPARGRPHGRFRRL